jgi:hypothetical protein
MNCSVRSSLAARPQGPSLVGRGTGLYSPDRQPSPAPAMPVPFCRKFCVTSSAQARDFDDGIDGTIDHESNLKVSLFFLVVVVGDVEFFLPPYFLWTKMDWCYRSRRQLLTAVSGPQHL